MDDLDLSGLTDDQVVELAALLAREALRRSPAMQAAFQHAMIDEAERSRIAAASAQAGRAKAVREIEVQATRAGYEQEKEAHRRRVATGFAGLVNRAASIMGKPIAEVTIVWMPSMWGKGGARVHINQGQQGADARWHLVEYIEASQTLYTAPGLRSQSAALQDITRQICAIARALGITATTVIKGIDV
jgi:hypothetical protein